MTDLAEKLKKALEKGRSGQFVRENPYERLGLKENPFHPKFNSNNEDVFIVREDVLVNLAMQIGNAIRLYEENNITPFRHLLTHGLFGCGKSSTALHFTEDWAEFGFQDYETLYTSLSEWQPPNEHYEDYGASSQVLLTYERFLDKIRHVSKPLILFIDDLDYTVTGNPAIPRIPEFILDIENRVPHGVIIIGLINSLTVSILSDADQVISKATTLSEMAEAEDFARKARTFFSKFNPDHFFFPVYSKSEISNLIDIRLKVVRKASDLFSTKAIDKIAEYSMGLPINALDIASACLTELVSKELDKTTASVVTKVADQLGFSIGLKLVESINQEDADEKKALSPQRRKIVSYILENQYRDRFFYPKKRLDGLRSSDLAKFIDVNLSTMNYHIKFLTETPNRILESKTDAHDARSKIFYVDWKSPIASAVEILTVYHKLKQEKYNVTSQAILLPRRENE